VLSGAGVPINLIRGTIQGRGATFWPDSITSPTTPSIAIFGDGTSNGRGRAWLRDPDLFGKVTVTGNGELQVWNGQIRSGNGPAIEDSSTGPVSVVNCSIQSTLAAGDVVISDGNFGYSQLTFLNPLQTMPATATRAPGTDAMSTEVFTGHLGNGAPVFTGDAEYTTVAQNTASDVFQLVANRLRVQRAGRVTVSATITGGVDNAGSQLVLARVNPLNPLRNLDVDLAAEQSIAGPETRTIRVTGVIELQAGEEIRVHTGATNVAAVPNGLGSSLHVTWTGVR
jgi:hypothetical protein